MNDFEKAWKEASAIKGWLSREEAALLWRYATRAPNDGVIVEVGSYRGRSTVLLAHTGRPVIAIDPLDVNYSSKCGCVIKLEDAGIFWANIEPFENVVWLREKSEDADPEEKIAMLYVDANHEYPNPKRDFERFEKCLSAGAFVVYHDLNRRSVLQSIRELEAEGKIEAVQGAGTIAAFRLVVEEPKAAKKPKRTRKKK